MENLILTDSALFFYSFLLGFCLGFFFEIFRFLRLALPHPTIVVIIEDLIFCLPASFVFLLFTFAFSDGLVRYFSVCSAFLGFWIYFQTVGKVILFFSDRILRFVRFLLRFCFRTLLRPPFLVFKKITNSLFTKLKKQTILIAEHSRSVKFKKDKCRLLRTAENGFTSGKR